MPYFTENTIQFLQALSRHNNREWFQQHKNDYLQYAKEPFELFVQDLITAMQPYFDYNLALTPKEAIFRIYRDVRFSADKSPYKTHLGAVITPGGRRQPAIKGIYLEINPTELRVYSGLYRLTTNELKNVRNQIAYNLDTFASLISDNRFRKLFGEIRGAKNKRLPKDLLADAAQQPLLYNKQFYYFASWPVAVITEPGEQLLKRITTAFEICQPLTAFLYEGLS